ncbi:TetR/AcrR family transcriptional regulator [Solihabitans fulvus]|uniref:TetR/AcrR family transcriptional regulator n=2 Tax=Solihabitans fulvus TaxID=1892852 RepID=A0A5B2XDA0_9PSEU|nr:TetR/AcrR family transcriptional regulator [Solihabitans fulvus]
MTSEDEPPRIDLVWTRVARQPRRERPVLSIDRIVTASVELADAEGLDAVSMRRIAAELGSGTTSLYRHVSNKDDLLDLMVDEIYGEFDPPDAPSGDWLADLTLVARQGRARMLQHPWLASITSSRPALGPNALRHAEFALTAANPVHRDVTIVAMVLTAVQDFVLGATVAELAEREAHRQTGLTEEQWRAAVGPYIQRVIESGDYPAISRRVRDAEEPGREEQFELGLGCLLAGIAAKYAATGVRS